MPESFVSSGDLPVEGREPDAPVNSTPTVKIGSTPILASSNFRWKLISGTEPFSGEVDISPDALDIVIQNAPHATFIEIDNGELNSRAKLKFQNIYALYAIPSEQPDIKRVFLTDQRYWWKHVHIGRKYNMKKRVGVKYLQDPVQTLVVDSKDEFSYAPYSLRGYTTKWNVTQVLNDIFAELNSWASKNGIQLGTLQTPSGIDSLPIVNLEIDGTFDDALNRILGLMPGYSVTIDQDGNPRIYSVADGNESNYVGKGEGGPNSGGDGIMGHEMVGMGRIIRSHQRLIRPRNIEVLVQREFEIRFDSNEDAGATQAGKPFARIMDNVLDAPDWYTDLGKTRVAAGTFITFPQAFTAWGKPPGMQQLGFPQIRRAMMPYMSLWTGFLLNGRGDPRADWGRRVAAINNNYRTTYRLPYNWICMCLSFAANRVAILDPVTGSRALSPVYSDWSMIPGEKTLLKNLSVASNHNDGSMVDNFRGYPANGRLDYKYDDKDDNGNSIKRNTMQAPATVDIIDQEQGIIKYNYRGDQFGNYIQTLPSMVELEGQNTAVGMLPKGAGPTASLDARNGRSIMFDAVADGDQGGGDSGAAPILTSNHKSATIVTMMPGAPNNNAQYFKQVINLVDVKDLFTKDGFAAISNGTGPTLQIKVNHNLVTARYRWDDDKADVIEQAFMAGGANGFTPTNPGQQAEIDKSLDSIAINIRDLTTLADPLGGPIFDINGNISNSKDSGPSVWNVARAIAASTWATMADRPIGDGSIPITPAAAKAKIEGYISDISFEIASNGIHKFSVSLPEALPPIDPMKFMPNSLRNIISRAVVDRMF